MKTTVLSFALLAAGCLYTGNGTEGLPCNTDLECGGEQLCIQHVCGGPQVGSTGIGGDSTGEDDESSEGATAQPGDDESVAEACSADDSQCFDGDILQKCIDGKLHTLGCPGACGEAAPTLGCFEESPEGPVCYCQEDRAACDASEAGQYRCFDGRNNSQCIDGWWVPLDCDRVCDDAGYSGSSSCGPGESNDVCFCEDSCEDGALRCVNDHRAAQCSYGSWIFYECADVCAENGKIASLGCYFYSGDVTEACHCI